MLSVQYVALIALSQCIRNVTSTCLGTPRSAEYIAREAKSARCTFIHPLVARSKSARKCSRARYAIFWLAHFLIAHACTRRALAHMASQQRALRSSQRTKPHRARHWIRAPRELWEHDFLQCESDDGLRNIYADINRGHSHTTFNPKCQQFHEKRQDLDRLLTSRLKGRFIMEKKDLLKERSFIKNT